MPVREQALPTDASQAKRIRAVRFVGPDFEVIERAARHQALPVSVFIRSAALREARRVLNPEPGASAA